MLERSRGAAGTVAPGPKVPLAGSKVEPLPVQTAARSPQSNQSWHHQWRSGALVEDAGLSGRQMQQCRRRKSRLSAMRGCNQDRSARIIIAGHAFLQNVRRGHYELAVDRPVNRRVAVAFDELALAI
jgi:hypothetical protein